MKLLKICLVLLLGNGLLMSCGGGGSDSSVDRDVDSPDVDSIAPSGYRISSDADEIDVSNVDDFSFNVTGAEIGTQFQYEIFDASFVNIPALVEMGDVIEESFSVRGIDLTSLEDGAIRIDFFLTDGVNLGERQSIDLTKNTRLLLEPVTISGAITYEFVTHFLRSPGLDFENAEVRPARGIQVVVLDALGNQLSSTLTSDSGEYSFTVEANTSVRIQAFARTVKTGTPAWDVSISDNTNNNSLYVLNGSLISSGSTDSIRNLHAPSGQGTPDYDNIRASAPFAILDTIYTTIQRFIAVDAEVVFPELPVRWSVNNNSLSGGDRAAGNIGTSFYSQGEIFILGEADLDTDEYDAHVIIHEWGHYFEDMLSRTDSIGGVHSLRDRLDLRLAFGEER